MKIFVSYSSLDRTTVEGLVQDLRDMEYEVWYDQDLKGGHEWWQDICQHIREYDLFVVALSPNYIASPPCQDEMKYAQSLRKLVLPLLIIDTPETIIPINLSQIQRVDYRHNQKSEVIALQRAIKNLPPALQMPEPLPKVPDQPSSLLQRLRSTLISKKTMNKDTQLDAFTILQDAYFNEHTRNDAYALMNILMHREDLYAVTYKKIVSIINAADIVSNSPETKFTISPRSVKILKSHISQVLDYDFTINISDIYLTTYINSQQNQSVSIYEARLEASTNSDIIDEVITRDWYYDPVTSDDYVRKWIIPTKPEALEAMIDEIAADLIAIFEIVKWDITSGDFSRQ